MPNNHKKSQVVVQKCQEEYQAQACQLIRNVIAEEFSSASDAYPANDLEDLSASYGKLGESFFVALHQGEVVGTVGVKREDDRVAMLRRLFVRKDFRGQGIGCELIQRAIQFCEEVGYQEMMFKTTSAMEGAIQLCKQLGFVPRARLNLGPIELLKFVFLLKPQKAQAKK